MPTIKSLDDLKRIREEALKKQQLKETSGKTEVVVGMGTVGIAAGAFEPIIQVILPGEDKVTYVKVTPDMIPRIIKEHILGGEIVTEYQLES